MNNETIPDFSKSDGLVPAVVQSCQSKEVLMLGYMNEEAFIKTKESRLVTFYSRSRSTLWTKGETSGNVLRVKGISLDCDSDAVLVLADPEGPTCHTGKSSCFFREVVAKEEENARFSLSFLQSIIHSRKTDGADTSYTRSLFESGINKIAQKVGEEATEVVIAALAEPDEKFLEESADLLFHFLVLLSGKGMTLEDVERVLEVRHK